ncbi:hypothetical protein AVEN_245049-1 [Araneus ventricosus]|uniref:Uncharacterized protein n=1 Tax=Araneus ventricosus TaxID=182803 RepID=A0A4Y2E925_ARAVE|nr:hypothetical protein AVEN_245049-1 [Araneus ventricosus]
METIFGWCIQGRCSLSDLNSAKSVCYNLLVEETLSRTLESFWNIESLGVKSPDERLVDEVALRLFENSILQNNDRYEELGLECDAHKDVLSFNAQNIIEYIQENEQTKRCVLKAVSRIFDPLGFLVPFVIQAKVLFQDLWLTCIDWDNPLAVASQSKWIEWHEQLKELPKVQKPQRYFCTDVDTSHEWELHCFNDSLQSAYGSVVYLKFSHVDETKTAFIISKSRVAPLKNCLCQDLNSWLHY